MQEDSKWIDEILDATNEEASEVDDYAGWLVNSIETLTLKEVKEQIETLFGGEKADIYRLFYDSKVSRDFDADSGEFKTFQEFGVQMDLGGDPYYMCFLWDFTNGCISNWAPVKDYEFKDCAADNKIVNIKRRDMNKKLYDIK